MAQEIIDVGNTANDGTGDPLRVAFEKINNNFSEIFSIPPAAGPNGSVQYNVITIATGAEAEAAILNGAVTEITVTSNGVNYISSDIPIVTITPALGDTTGYGATAVAVLDGMGGVGNITITNSGADYTLPPVVQIQSITNNVLTGSANLIYNDFNNTLTLNGSLLRKIGGNLNIGNASNPATQIYAGQTALKIGNISVNEDANTLTYNVSVFPGKKADFVINDLYANNLNYGNTTTFSQKVFQTTDSTPNQVALSLPVSGFSSCIIEIVTRDNGANSQTSTINSVLINDGSGVRFNVSGGVFVGDALVTYDMDVTGSEARLLLNPLSSVNMTHNINYKIAQ